MRKRETPPEIILSLEPPTVRKSVLRKRSGTLQNIRESPLAVRHSPFPMIPRALPLLCGLLTLAAFPLTAAEQAPAARFSQSLSNADRTTAGLNRLSSDQVAVLDALVRRDLAVLTAPRRNDATPLAACFSQRLSADEQRNAGFAVLTETELAQLDGFVDRNAAPSLARSLLAPPAFVPLSVRARVAEAKPTKPEIHGSFFLSYGVGSGGYSEKTGGMTLTYEDPVRNFAVSFSYTESHIKGGGPYYLRDPLYEADRFPRYSTEH